MLPQPISTVTVLGGGSAGFLTAIALVSRLPQLAVAVLRTEQIPIIGVGEATTAWIPWFLHNYLKLERRRFFKETGATWKLGIRFEWGERTGHFNYPFGPFLNNRFELLHKHTGFYCRNDLNIASYFAQLMEKNRSPVVRDCNGRLTCDARAGYHIENAPFVAYLERIAAERGIHVINTKVEAAESLSNGDVSCLHCTDGLKIRSDLFVDCSGFRSQLLSGLLQEPYISFADSLFCDTAVTGTWKRHAPVFPYTTAETMDSGWCWRIDLRDRVNRGYVFAASFCDVDSAIAEMRAKNPAMEDEVRTINFRSGRHERFWVRNVAAVGNASGFVEPLESTGLHMIADTARCLCEALVDSDCRPTNGIKAVANAVVAQRWDDIRNFLSIHFKFNNRLDTPFWLHCRAHTNIGDAERIVDFYKANGPSPFGFALLPHSSIFGIGGYLTMLLGQQVPSDYHNACECDEEEKWRLLVRRVDEFARAALPMDQALDALLDDDLEWSWGSCNTPCFDAYAAATGDS